VDRFEVIVIGAGPAGTIAARDLARMGVPVAIVDGSHPREKPCGGGVTGRALALVTGSPGSSGSTGSPGSTGSTGSGSPGWVGFSGFSQAIRAIRFEAGSGAATIDLPGGYLEVFSREAFDGALLAEARRAGAAAIAARGSRIERSGGGWIVTAGDRRIEARWLLGADGAGGVVRKQVTRPFGRSQLSIAAGVYVDGSDVSEIVIRFVDEPRGYLWSFPRPGHLAIGTCAQADVTSAAGMHAVTDRWLDGYAPAAGRARRRYAWPIPSLSAADLDAEQPSGPGWMLLGDAAGLVDPITREGIFFALRSGQLAAAALGTRDPARHYAAGVRDELHDELRRAARFKAGFFRPRFTSLLVDALGHSAPVRDVLIDLVAGRQPYRGLKRRLLATLEIGLAWRALRGDRI
jgi:flavin-dependent dehydrogenase